MYQRHSDLGFVLISSVLERCAILKHETNKKFTESGHVWLMGKHDEEKAQKILTKKLRKMFSDTPFYFRKLGVGMD
jgi:hypothetical protein